MWLTITNINSEFLVVEFAWDCQARIVLEIEAFLINLHQSRSSIVVQIYTSVLKTKVKLIEYAFERLPACGLALPPSKTQ